jgi:hypothetical protein
MVPVDRYPSLQCAVESKMYAQYAGGRDNVDLASTTVQAPSPIHVQTDGGLTVSCTLASKRCRCPFSYLGLYNEFADFSDNESDGASLATQSEVVDETCATNHAADDEEAATSPDVTNEYEDVQQSEDEPVVVPPAEVAEDWVDLADEVNRGIDDGSSWEVDV